MIYTYPCITGVSCCKKIAENNKHKMADEWFLILFECSCAFRHFTGIAENESFEPTDNGFRSLGPNFRPKLVLFLIMYNVFASVSLARIILLGFSVLVQPVDRLSLHQQMERGFLPAFIL